MRILDIYIGKILLSHIMLTAMVLLGLFTFVTFIDELGNLDKGRYGIAQVIQYVVLSIPKTLYEVFPMVALIGSIMGLSVLARDSELIVMRAAGVSIARIVISVLKVGVVLAIIASIIGEIVSPYTETKAQRMRAESLQTTNIGQEQDFGLWMRDDNTYVNIGEVLPDLTLLRVKIFEFDNQNFLRFLSVAEQGEFDENQRWLLKGLQRTMIDEERSEADSINAAYWSTLVSPDILQVFMIQPEQLSIWQLDRYIEHLRTNKQETNNYELAYWSKLVTPFATIVMLVLAVPFVFKSARSGSLGRSLFSGIMIGLAFFILNRAFTFFVPLFGIPPLLGATVPTLMVFTLSIVMIRRVA